MAKGKAMPRVLIAVLALAVAAPAEADMYRGTETPNYKVERQVGGSELRDYGATVVAEVTVQGSRSGAANAGFRVLAGYIFGGNAAQEKIAMTTPVAQVPQGDTPGTEWTVRFTLPAGSTLATLPRPDDPSVRFLQTEARQMLVTTFSGVPTESALEASLASLKEDARSAGLTPIGPPEYMFYDPPWRMPWNRRNEVALPVQ